MSEQKVSFKPVGASAPSAASQQPPIEIDAKASTAVDTSAALAPRSASEVAKQPTPSYSFGGEDEGVDAGDIRYPRLNVAQPTSAEALVALGRGHFILNKELSLGNKIRAIVVGFGPKSYIEKTKYKRGANSNAKIARSLQEVDALGGTISWRESKENAKANSEKPWFQPSVTALLLIEKPDGVAEDRFSFVPEGGGKCYAAALYSVKSTSYDSVYVKLNSEQKTGLLRDGFPTRFIEITTDLKVFEGGEAYQPLVKVLEKVSPEVEAMARKLRG
jgi:hypothetical protein